VSFIAGIIYIFEKIGDYGNFVDWFKAQLNTLSFILLSGLLFIFALMSNIRIKINDTENKLKNCEKDRSDFKSAAEFYQKESEKYKKDSEKFRKEATSKLRSARLKAMRFVIMNKPIPLDILQAIFPFVLVSAGNIQFLGSSLYYVNTKVNDFDISVYPITNEQYKLFLDENEYAAPSQWKNRTYLEGEEDHPVVGISKIDADKFCQWLSQITGEEFRLPAEEEWEKAAFGINGLPDIDNFNETTCNCPESKFDGTTPVYQYEDVTSPYGTCDMIGNVWEWTQTTEERGEFVVRGGAYNGLGKDSNFREFYPSTTVANSIGFRVARVVKP
jgi:hypothetical protein